MCSKDLFLLLLLCPLLNATPVPHPEAGDGMLDGVRDITNGALGIFGLQLKDQVQHQAFPPRLPVEETVVYNDHPIDGESCFVHVIDGTVINIECKVLFDTTDESSYLPETSGDICYELPVKHELSTGIDRTFNIIGEKIKKAKEAKIALVQKTCTTIKKVKEEVVGIIDKKKEVKKKIAAPVIKIVEPVVQKAKETAVKIGEKKKAAAGVIIENGKEVKKTVAGVGLIAKKVKEGVIVAGKVNKAKEIIGGIKEGKVQTVKEVIGGKVDKFKDVVGGIKSQETDQQHYQQLIYHQQPIIRTLPPIYVTSPVGYPTFAAHSHITSPTSLPTHPYHTQTIGSPFAYPAQHSISIASPTNIQPESYKSHPIASPSTSIILPALTQNLKDSAPIASSEWTEPEVEATQTSPVFARAPRNIGTMPPLKSFVHFNQKK